MVDRGGEILEVIAPPKSDTNVLPSVSDSVHRAADRVGGSRSSVRLQDSDENHAAQENRGPHEEERPGSPVLLGQHGANDELRRRDLGAILKNQGCVEKDQE